MSQPDNRPADASTPDVDSPDDRLTRFLIDGAGVRGVLVHLQDTWKDIGACAVDASRQAPAAVELLGEAAAAAALFTGHTKVDGRLSVQLRGSGALRTLFAECTAAGTLRGIVQLDESAGAVSRDLRELGDDAVLAITSESRARDDGAPMRYQGLVARQQAAQFRLFLLARAGRVDAGLAGRGRSAGSGGRWRRRHPLRVLWAPLSLQRGGNTWIAGPLRLGSAGSGPPAMNGPEWDRLHSAFIVKDS